MSYWKTLRRVMAALVVITAIAIVANASNEFPARSASASTIVQTFKPVADAWVNAAAPDKVSGTGYELQVDGTPVQIAYFNFNLSALSGTVISATLKLSVTTNGSVDGGSVSTVSDTSWTETTLTYNNRPAISAPIASIGAAPANQAVTVDVTSAVTSGGILGLAVASTNGDGVSYASRENSLPPVLTVTVGTSTPTSTATSTATSTDSSTSTATPTATTTATSTATSTATATATATPSPTPTGTPISTQTYIFRASADAFANSSAPDTVSGTGFEIPVDGSPDRLDYLTFNVTGLSGTIMSATLKLSTTWDGSVDGGTIGKVTDTSWTESTLTYNNRPAISPPSVSIGPVVPYQSVTKDVTAAITGNGAAGFAIFSTNGDGVTYASRESSTPPILTIVTGVFSTATPTPTATATSTATATATVTPTPTPTPTGTPFSGPVIAAAGDISCDPTSSHYFNGLGDPTHCQQMATSNLLLQMQPTAVLTLGDNQYMENTLAQYMAVFDQTWGRLKSIIHPAVGNHEYLTANAAGYFAYYGAAAGDPSKGYYSYDIGSWHIITLNSECAQIGGCNKGSPEEIWLSNDLATHSNQCTLAVWHEPEFDSGPNGSGTFYLDFWNDLYRGGADIILNGHSHLYERFGPQTPTGVSDPAHGIVQFTVGTGGDDLDTFHTVRPNSMARDSNDFGVLQLTLGDGGYNWQFVTIPGSSGFTDSGSASCHAAP